MAIEVREVELLGGVKEPSFDREGWWGEKLRVARGWGSGVRWWRWTVLGGDLGGWSVIEVRAEGRRRRRRGKRGRRGKCILLVSGGGVGCERVRGTQGKR